MCLLLFETCTLAQLCSVVLCWEGTWPLCFIHQLFFHSSPALAAFVYPSPGFFYPNGLCQMRRCKLGGPLSKSLFMWQLGLWVVLCWFTHFSPCSILIISTSPVTHNSLFCIFSFLAFLLHFHEEREREKASALSVCSNTQCIRWMFNLHIYFDLQLDFSIFSHFTLLVSCNFHYSCAFFYSLPLYFSRFL